jgi:hypothetical protein
MGKNQRIAAALGDAAVVPLGEGFGVVNGDHFPLDAGQGRLIHGADGGEFDGVDAADDQGDHGSSLQ